MGIDMPKKSIDSENSGANELDESKPLTRDRQVASFCSQKQESKGGIKGEGCAEENPKYKKSRRRVDNQGAVGLWIERRSDRQVSTWVYRFRLAGRQCELRLGSYPSMSLKSARAAHKNAVSLVDQGIDPRKHRSAERARNLAAWTMHDAFERWIEKYAIANTKRGTAPSSRTVAQQKSRWKLHLAPRLGGLYVRDVTRQLLIDVLSGVSPKAKEEARKCLGLISMLMEYCEDQEQIAQNPAAGIKPAKIQARPNRPRERHLNLEELQELWGELDNSQCGKEGIASTAVLTLTMANAIKLLILTGMRREEVAAMTWREVRGHEWCIGSERTKSLKGHRVYLSSQARRTLDEQLKHTENLNSPYVFPSRDCGSKHLHPDSITTAVARLQGRAKKKHNHLAPLYSLKHFTAHDLRRSAATLWTERLTADPLLVEKMLSHSLPTLIETYNRSERWPEMIHVWKRWGELFESNEAGEVQSNNVVAFRPR